MLTQASIRKGNHPGGGKNRPLSTVELLKSEEDIDYNTVTVQRKFSLGNTGNPTADDPTNLFVCRDNVNDNVKLNDIENNNCSSHKKQEKLNYDNKDKEDTESSECSGDNYFYDFFDRNLKLEGEEKDEVAGNNNNNNNINEGVNPSSLDNETLTVDNVKGCTDSNTVPNTSVSDKLIPLENEPSCSQTEVDNSDKNRPHSWYESKSPEDSRKVKRRQTHPGHHADYREALSSLLWQPYECQRGEVISCSSPDDSDVAFWLGCRLPELRIPLDLSSSSSTASPTSTISSRDSLLDGGDAVKRLKDVGSNNWGKEPSGSSLRGLLEEQRVSDPELERLPLGALHHPQQQLSRTSTVSVKLDAGSDGVSTNMVVDSVTRSGNPVVSVSVVRCYERDRQTVSTVPSIECSNTANDVTSYTTTPTVRTFTSTEAQTDDVVVDVVRPRDRRRHTRRPQPPPPAPSSSSIAAAPLTDRLPDILNSHLPPPYSTLPIGLPPPVVPHLPPPPVPVLPPPGSPPPTPSNIVGGLRFPFAIVPAGRRRSPQYTSQQEPKSCCGVTVSQTVSIRWCILLIFLVGLCCAVFGTILGATKSSGREHLTVSLLMIGVGVVLVTVSGVAWRLTSQDAPSCRAMLGLSGSDEGNGSEPNRRFVPRLPPSYGRPHHPYAAMMYPEFQYRAPPPSYQASMQEYRLRLLLLDRHTGPTGNSVSPPPTYRSQAGSLLRAPIGCTRRDLIHYQAPSQSDYSRPPSYRSRSSSTRPGIIPGDPTTHSVGTHSRDPSQLSVSDSSGVCGVVGSSAVNVITVMGHNTNHGTHHDSESIIKMVPDESALPVSTITGISNTKDNDNIKDSNLVTIVQTSSEPTGPVIVTISGNTADDGSSSQCRDTEMEILAHL
ncbi:uncharacterized protein LOC142330053 [Lycorma delicatula]|uniref:uncharacterized protein LOC142330053 n=1 Tax=Lycorma delicatula TaxID=130591 RepID=UPI003F51A698